MKKQYTSTKSLHDIVKTEAMAMEKQRSLNTKPHPKSKKISKSILKKTQKNQRSHAKEKRNQDIEKTKNPNTIANELI